MTDHRHMVAGGGHSQEALIELVCCCRVWGGQRPQQKHRRDAP